MKRFKSEQTKQAAVGLVRGGTPVAQVAKTYGVSDASVRNWMKASGPARIAPPVAAMPSVARPNLGRVRDAIQTLSEAGLI